MKKFISIITIFFFFNEVNSQNYILDSLTKEPIEAVNIQYDQNKGQVTNQDGLFELSNNITSDSILFSHISYNSKNISIRDLSPNDTIYLKPSSIELGKVNIETKSAIDIIKMAVERFSSNYYQENYNLSGFFRQVLEEDSTGVEAIEVKFLSYIDSQDKSNTKIIGARKTKNHSTLNFKTTGGIAHIIENAHNLFDNIDFLKPDYFNLYQYNFLGKIEGKKNPILKIGFEPVNASDLKALREGVLFIDSKNFGILDMVYSFNKEKLKMLIDSTGIKKSKKLHFLKLDIENHINYRTNQSGKLVLSYVHFKDKLKGVHNKESRVYNLIGKLVIDSTNFKNPVKVKTNYNTSKDFGRAIKQFEAPNEWDDSYQLPFSQFEKKIFQDITNQD